MRSMTGYGRCRAERDGREMTVEVRSVNHRFLDVACRLPRSLSFLDDAVRKGAHQLESYEALLGLAERYRRLTEGLNEGLDALRDAPGERAQRARKILERLLLEEEE